MSNTLALILALFFSISLTAQQATKVDGALQSFLNSEFMVKMNDMRIEAEAAVRTFKQQSMNLNPDAVKKVHIGYEQTAARFNQVLTNIKADFLNPKKLKFIEKFPDDYLKGLELELYQLSDFYAVNFQQTLADARAENVDGSAIFLIISELIGLSKNLVSYFGQIRQNSRQYNEAYLMQNLYKPYRMKLWDEINQAGGYDSYQNYNNYSDPTYMDPTQNNMTYPTNDVPFPDINLPSLDNLNQQNQYQQDQYQQTDTYDQWLDTNQPDPNMQNDNWMDDPSFQPGNPAVDSTQTTIPNAKQATGPAQKEVKGTNKPKAKKNGNG